jgi:hypothetical protein
MSKPHYKSQKGGIDINFVFNRYYVYTPIILYLYVL